MRGKRIRSLFMGAMLAGVCSASLSASPIFGTFNIAGTVDVTLTTITWRLNDPPFPTEKTRIGPGATGSFTGLDGAIATEKNLNSVPEPVGVTFPAQTFIAFDTAPSLPTLDINFIYQGIY